jgi:alpha-L-fucosidase
MSSGCRVPSSVLPKGSQPRFGLMLGGSAEPRQLDLAQGRSVRRGFPSASALHSGFAAILLLICLTSVAPAQSAVPPPLPVMPIPTERQLEWQQRELAMFIHFTVNTFTNREWGDGTEDNSVFNPSALDVEQWVKVAREFGFRSIILTAKHHDGFCLWPSRYTDHSVRNSPWRDGHGDVVGELARACGKAGIRMGLYLSPWDRHEPSYGDELRYNLFYLAQLRELLTDYGSLSEVWFDGAKGKDARDMDYHFGIYWALVRQLQPGAVIFSDEGPDVRWIGNERGSAGESCWAMLDRSRVAVGKADTTYLNEGDPDGPDWVPGETDVSIRKGWFWHPDESPKSVAELIDIYFHSVGRNSVLLLNVPPDRRGRFADSDIRRLREWRQALDAIFDRNLAAGAPSRASNVRGDSTDFGPDKALDGHLESYWATDDDVRSAWLEFDLGTARRFNVCLLQEPIQLGQRVKQYRLEVETPSGWETISEGTTIGYKKLERFAAVEARRVRIRILDARACPLLAGFGLYLAPD